MGTLTHVLAHAGRREKLVAPPQLPLPPACMWGHVRELMCIQSCTAAGHPDLSMCIFSVLLCHQGTFQARLSGQSCCCAIRWGI